MERSSNPTMPPDSSTEIGATSHDFGGIAAAASRRSANERKWLEMIAAPHFAIPILLALAIPLSFLTLGGYPFYTKGEPREAVTVLNIVSGGGVILPRRAG